MTPQDLYDTLAALPDDAPLVFQTGDGAIGAGYHVTEFKLAEIASIDCGGRLANWSEAALQLLDGTGRDHMTVGKFSKILHQSIARLPGLGDTHLHVEFAHANNGLQIFQISVPELMEGVVAVHLSPNRAHCKPALEAAATRSEAKVGAIAGLTSVPNPAAGCCGAGPASASSCCQ
ncbi:MAG: DUF6428 family protein [Roseibium sp.]